MNNNINFKDIICAVEKDNILEYMIVKNNNTWQNLRSANFNFHDLVLDSPVNFKVIKTSLNQSILIDGNKILSVVAPQESNKNQTLINFKVCDDGSSEDINTIGITQDECSFFDVLKSIGNT
jgi:hypothetical protein